MKMNIRKLLAAASVLALSATSAQAVTLSLNSAAGVTPATQLEGTQPNVATPLNFTMTADTNYPGGTIQFVITLPEGLVFSTGPTNGNVSVTGGTLTSATVSAGGVIGSNSVTYDVVLADATTTAVIFDLDGKLSGCPAATTGLTVAATTGGAATGGGTGVGTLATVLNACATGFNAPAIVTNAVTEIDNANDFKTLDNGGLLGSVAYSIVAAVDKDYVGNALVATDNAGTSDVASASIPVNFANTAGIGSLNLTMGVSGVVINSGPAVGNVFTFAVPQAEMDTLFDATVDVISAVASAPTAEIEAQTITVGTATLTLSDNNANLAANTTVAGGTLKNLTREGQNTGVFSWNSGAGRSTNSVYRVTTTGLVDGTYGVSATLSNASPATANGTTRGTFTVTDNQAILQSGNGFGIMNFPTFNNGDVAFNFEVPNAVVVDRLLLRGNTLTSTATLDADAVDAQP